MFRVLAVSRMRARMRVCRVALRRKHRACRRQHACPQVLQVLQVLAVAEARRGGIEARWWETRSRGLSECQRPSPTSCRRALHCYHSCQSRSGSACKRVYMRQHSHVCTSLYVSITSICVSVCPFVLLPQVEDERLLREAQEMSVVRKKITNTDAYTSTEAQILTHIHALTSGRR